MKDIRQTLLNLIKTLPEDEQKKAYDYLCKLELAQNTEGFAILKRFVEGYDNSNALEKVIAGVMGGLLASMFSNFQEHAEELKGNNGAHHGMEIIIGTMNAYSAKMAEITRECEAECAKSKATH